MTTDRPRPIRTLRGAILRPSRPGDGQGIAQHCGVFDAGRAPVAEAMVTARRSLSLPCACPDTAGLPLRRGRWLYGGIGYHHFGHALIFSTARLWPLADPGLAVDGILFLDRNAEGRTRPSTTRHLQAQLRLLGVDLPVWTVGSDEVVEELLVPTQAISTAPDLFSGTLAYRRFMRKALARIPAAGPGPRLYISRSRLGPQKAGLIFEDRLQARLAEQGYQIYHPQAHPLEAQIAALRGASHIIGIDGSAMHLAAFAARPDARIAILARRPFYADAFAAQAHAFSGAEAVAIDAIGTVHAPVSALQDGSLWFRALCEIRFADLARALAANGFIERAAAWRAPKPARLARRLDLAARRGGEALVAVPQARDMTLEI